ncbi:P-loop containing nucleoside triphosphate hydrolase protein, partial [Baffinella frigidus]
GGLGLSLTTASRCYMMDLWWNAAVDEQAMARIHRIGQTRAVTVVRLVCQGSIEEKILEMQVYPGKPIFL